MGADQKRKEARKRKFGAQLVPANSQSQPMTTAMTSQPDDAAEQQTPRKKQRKETVPLIPIAKIYAADKEDAGDTPAVDGDSQNENNDDAQDEPSQDPTDSKSQRFIVFIGNLPFSATDTSIAAHFAKVHPTSIRHRTDKTTGRSKGFAFLEFEAYDRMKTCLKLYHHSNFEEEGDGKGKGGGKGRRLNVELTVGGGGKKSKDRKAKLRDKNAKLNEQRQRRAEEERKQEGAAAESEGKKMKSKTKTGSKKGSSRVKGKGEQEEAEVKEVAEPASTHDADQDGDIHPSRRSRMRRS